MFPATLRHARNSVRRANSYLDKAKSVVASAFDYELPEERIAYRPLPDRGSSKMLVVSRPEQEVMDQHFCDLPELLPSNSLMVLNTSRVIPARLFMQKPTGGRVEVMLLSPMDNLDPAVALTSESWTTRWKCFVGGRRIKPGHSLAAPMSSARINGKSDFSLVAHVLERDGPVAVVSFSLAQSEEAGLPAQTRDTVDNSVTLRDVINVLGHNPLPPYIKRDDDDSDTYRYQTVYADKEGSVAAPTAGLHMTKDILHELKSKGLSFAEVTLHVGAGTFAQLGGPLAGDHVMHEERVSVLEKELKRIIEHVAAGGPVVALVRIVVLNGHVSRAPRVCQPAPE